MQNNQKSVVAPASKSSSLRALICCLLHKDQTSLQIKNISLCQDVKSALQVIKQLRRQEQTITARDLKIDFLKGISNIQKLKFNVGESGFLARSLVSIACLFSQEFIIEGLASINRRNLGIKPFADILGLEAQSSYLPVKIKGIIEGRDYIINEHSSSQFLSGLLFTLPLLDNDSTIKIEQMVSRQYINLTLHYLTKCKVKYLVEDNNLIKIPGRQEYKFNELTVESDWSSLPYLIAVGLMLGGLVIEDIVDSPHSPDRVFLNLLTEIGGNYTFQGNNILKVEKSHIKGFTFDLTSSPDLAAVLVSLALIATSPSKLTNCYRLRNKESDRLIALMDMISSLGAHYIYEDDALTIFPHELKGGHIKSYDDHRIAMSALILNALDSCNVTVDNYDCIDKSYPDFITDMKKLGVNL